MLLPGFIAPSSGMAIMCDPIDIDECIEIDMGSIATSSPLTTVTNSLRQLQIARNAPPMSKGGRQRHAHKGRIARQLHAKKTNKRKPAVLRMVSELVRQDVITFFANHFEKALVEWITILTKTTMPENIASSDPYIITAFRYLDEARIGKDSTRSRLAYIRLIHVFELLEEIVASDRENGRLRNRDSGYRNASVAIDVYISAQQQTNISRQEVIERKRIARHWRILAEPSPIFVLIYSEVAEGVA